MSSIKVKKTSSSRGLWKSGVFPKPTRSMVAKMEDVSVDLFQTLGALFGVVSLHVIGINP